MTESGAHKLYTLRTHPVHTAALLLACFAAPASAQIMDTFETFQAHCLTPMYAFEEYSGAGLLPAPSNREGLSRFWFARQSIGPTVILFNTDPDQGRRSCAVVTTANTFPDQFEVWITSEVALGHFEPDGDQRWLTVGRVEPRLAVEFETPDTGLAIARVIETNLES